MVFKDQDEIDSMLEEFAMAKEGALPTMTLKPLKSINQAVDAYYNGIIKEEFEAVDPEEPDYDYVMEACEKALKANPENARAYYYMAASL